MIRTVTFHVAASCFLFFFASAALADDKKVCSDAYAQAQMLRDAHKLTGAREQLRICARAECPGFIAKDCAGWLKDVDPRMPSVVLVATSATGAALTDVKVTMDGAPLVTKLDGLAVDVDPGAHTFAFEAKEGRAEQKAVITEGGKAQRIAVTLGATGATTAPSAPGATTTVGAGASSSAAASAAPAAPAAASGASKFNFFPKEPVVSGVSVSFRLGWGFPFGNDGHPEFGIGNDSLSTQANGQVAFWFDAGYLVNPYLYLGADFSYGIVPVPGSAGAGDCGQIGASCSGNDVRVGAEVQYRILGPNALQPWLGLGFLGYERISISGSSSISGATGGLAFDGIEWVTPQAGFDYKIFPALSAGLFAGVSLSQYLGVSVVNAPSNSVTMEGNPLHGWVFLGGRVNYDLHI